MSNHKYAYGWDGHILVSEEWDESIPERNQIAVPDEVIARIYEAHADDEMDERIHVERLGVHGSDVIILATGRAFTNAWPGYGTIFLEADTLAEGCNAVSRDDLNRPYMLAMQEVYGLSLPPPRMMVGVASQR